MDKRSVKWITWGFMVLMFLVVVLMLSNMLHRTTDIVLPDTSVSSDRPSEDAEGATGSLTVIKVTPKTVQAAIATLARPAQYSRTVSVQQLWPGGSGTYDVTVKVNNGLTRTDRTISNSQIRHTITGAEEAYIWYNNETNVYAAPAGTISADSEQSIPTYEDVLALPVDEIAAADYRVNSGVNCIYVETTQDAYGYVLHYWVSVDSGLLVAAEKLQNDEAVYRMSALTLDQGIPTDQDFILPDGRRLLEPGE